MSCKEMDHKCSYSGWDGTNKFALDKDGNQICVIRAFAFSITREATPIYIMEKDREKFYEDRKNGKKQIAGTIIFDTLPTSKHVIFDIVLIAIDEITGREMRKYFRDVEIIELDRKEVSLDTLVPDEMYTFIAMACTCPQWETITK